MPFLKTSIDEPTERVSIQVQLGSQWKIQTGPYSYPEITADLDKSLGSLATAATGGAAITADFDQSLGLLALSADGGQPVAAADLDQSLGILSISADASVPIDASLSKTFGALTVSAAATMPASADLNQTLGSILLSATGGEVMYWDATYEVAGSDFTTTSTTAVDITGLSHAAAANSVYEVEIKLIGQCSSTAGLAISIGFSAAGATGTWNGLGSNLVTTLSQTGNLFGTLGGANFWTSNASDEMISQWGILKTGANTGNITAQVKKNTSGTATVYIGSVMKIKKLA